MINNRVNYYEYLGLKPEATIEDIKKAIQENEAYFIRDGIDKKSISKIMVNELSRNLERDNYLRLLQQRQETPNMEFDDEEVDDLFDEFDIDEVKNVVCWNCGSTYETGMFYDEFCPHCNAEVSSKKFNEEIVRLERQITENGTREQLMYAVDLLMKKYASKPSYKAHQVLLSIRDRVDNLLTLDVVHDQINVALKLIEKNYKSKRIFSAYKEYEKNKDIFISEGLDFDNRIINVINEHKKCEEYLYNIVEASKNKNYSGIFSNVKELKSRAIDCYEIDKIMKEVPIPAVTNLKVLEIEHKIHLSWDYSIEGVYFSIHKIIDGVESNIVDEIYDNRYEYVETLNGAEITYKVCAHFENLNSIDNPTYKIRFFDNVKGLVEQKVSGAIAYKWSAPDDCDIIVIKKENEVPNDWQDGTLLTEVNNHGFIDKLVKKGKSYGYKIKCVYNFKGSNFESKEINIHPVYPHYDFLPITIINQETNYDNNTWKVEYHPLGLGTPILFENHIKMDIDEEKVYLLEDLKKMNFDNKPIQIKENSLLVSLEYGREYNFYLGVILEDKVLLKSPLKIISNGNIYDLNINNVGGLNKTLEISYKWGVKSKQIIIVDNEDYYLEDYSNVIDTVFKFKNENSDIDKIIFNLKDRKNHFITIFEVDDMGKSKIIKKLEPITKNVANLYYDIKFKKNKVITNLYFNSSCKIDDVYLSRVNVNRTLEPIYGPIELIIKHSILKGYFASFTYECENVDINDEYVLRFSDNKDSKIFKINGNLLLLVLKEKKYE